MSSEGRNLFSGLANTMTIPSLLEVFGESRGADGLLSFDSEYSRGAIWVANDESFEASEAYAESRGQLLSLLRDEGVDLKNTDFLLDVTRAYFGSSRGSMARMWVSPKQDPNDEFQVAWRSDHQTWSADIPKNSKVLFRVKRINYHEVE